MVKLESTKENKKTTGLPNSQKIRKDDLSGVEEALTNIIANSVGGKFNEMVGGKRVEREAEHRSSVNTYRDRPLLYIITAST
jgi:hypothetical protein